MELFNKNIFLKVFVVGFVLLLTACASSPNVKGAFPPATPNAVAGAGVGAVTGIAVAGMTNTAKPLTGAIVGAMIGAPIGSYADQQGAILNLQHQGVTIIQLGDILEIDIPSDLLFEGGEVEFRERAYPLMGQVMALLQQYGPVGMAVEGYTDGVGSTFDKLRRGELQAQSVTTYLWTHGVNLNRLHYVGMGDSITVGDPRTTIGSAYNRRVTITLWRDSPPSPVKVYAKIKDDCWTMDDPEYCNG